MKYQPAANVSANPRRKVIMTFRLTCQCDPIPTVPKRYSNPARWSRNPLPEETPTHIKQKPR